MRSWIAAGLAALVLALPATAQAQKPETAVQGYINVSLTAIIMTAAVIILVDSIRQWLGAGRRKEPITHEAPLPSISV